MSPGETIWTCGHGASSRRKRQLGTRSWTQTIAKPAQAGRKGDAKPIHSTRLPTANPRGLTGGLSVWTQSVQNGVYAAIIFVGAPLVIADDITTGVLVATSILGSRMRAPMAQVTQLLGRFQHARVAMGSLNQFMALPVGSADADHRIPLPAVNGDFALRSSVFTYADPNAPPALTIGSLDIAAGERIALLGRNGAGKSTLLQGLSGLLQPMSGELLLDGLALHQVDPEVATGQLLAQLDPTQAGSTVEESAAKYRAALASATRLRAEANGTPLAFPAELDRFPDLKASESRLYATRRGSLKSSLGPIDQSLALFGREGTIGQRLISVGAASNVEVLRLQRQRAHLELKKADLRSQYMAEARQELAKVTEDIDSLAPVVRGRSDTLSRLTLRCARR